MKEAKSAAVTEWYAGTKEQLVSAVWCVTEFASALGIKKRTSQLSGEQAELAWLGFQRMCASDLQLTPVEPPVFHQATVLALDTATGLRAGDALHLATALDCKAKAIATLDALLARNAGKRKVKPVEF